MFDFNHEHILIYTIPNIFDMDPFPALILDKLLSDIPLPAFQMYGNVCQS